MMVSVRTHVTYENIICQNLCYMSGLRTYITYENMLCPKPCYTRKCNVFFVRTSFTYKMCNVQTYMYVTHEYEIIVVQTNIKYENE